MILLLPKLKVDCLIQMNMNNVIKILQRNVVI